MPESRLDSDGRLPLSADLLRELGWKAGQEVLLAVDGDQLLVQPATPGARLKEEARQLASSMRELTTDAVHAAAETVQRLAGGAEGAAAAVPESRSEPARTPVAPFRGVSPRIPDSAYLALGCSVIGDVTLGEDCSLWPGVVVRGDVASIRVGARTNIQDGTVVHVSPQLPCSIGSGVTIGHQATVHACTVGDNTLIGIHAVVLDGAKIGEHCIIAAGAVVPPGMEVPDGKMVMGVPAKILRDLTPQEIERVHWNADAYVSLKAQYVNPSAEPAPPAAVESHARPEPPARGALARYEVRRAAGAILADGSLDDPGWNGIPPASPLVHSDGTGPLAQSTEVRACWDDERLYVAFSCKDTDVWANFERRDDPLYDEEVVEVFLSPTGDLRHYFEIELSPANVLFDATVFNPEGDRATMLVDRTWDSPGIRTGVRVAGKLNERSSRDLGWIAEIAIPFRDLGLAGPPAPGTVWRANFYRIERGEVTEFGAWSPTYADPPDFHVPRCFGELVFTAA